MSRREGTAHSIQFSFRVPCTAWPAICTRSSSPPRGPVPAAPALAEVVAEADFLAEALAEAEAARSERSLSQFPSGLVSISVVLTRGLRPFGFAQGKLWAFLSLLRSLGFRTSHLTRLRKRIQEVYSPTARPEKAR